MTGKTSGKRGGNHNEAHTALVNAALIALATAGYQAWANQTGVWFEENENAPDKKGRPHKYGKPGSGDIMLVMPPEGRHVECEAKTGKGTQNDNQKIHQEFVVERNGGAYILFYTVEELMQKLACITPSGFPKLSVT